MSQIKKIKINNFKNLEDVEIEVKPLTFLFGPNGSGKSSFIKALMFLQENIFPINNSLTHYKLKSGINLDSYKEIITNNDCEKDLVYEIKLKGKYNFVDDRVFDLESNSDYFQYIKDGDLFFLVENFLNELEKENYFNGSRLLAEDQIGLIDTDKLRIYENHNYDIKTITTFTNEINGKNLKSIKIIDELSKSTLEYDVFKKEMLKL
ncbi:MAG: AAA family ATPase [Bacteroidota bacterium]|nr:AAA family ATPase [Bacteroidota bacterium]